MSSGGDRDDEQRSYGSLAARTRALIEPYRALQSALIRFSWYDGAILITADVATRYCVLYWLYLTLVLIRVSWSDDKSVRPLWVNVANERGYFQKK
jgi:hypothetical protein